MANAVRRVSRAAIVEMRARGDSVPRIAKALGISGSTVARHIIALKKAGLLPEGIAPRGRT